MQHTLAAVDIQTPVPVDLCVSSSATVLFLSRKTAIFVTFTTGTGLYSTPIVCYGCQLTQVKWCSDSWCAQIVLSFSLVIYKTTVIHIEALEVIQCKRVKFAVTLRCSNKPYIIFSYNACVKKKALDCVSECEYNWEWDTDEGENCLCLLDTSRKMFVSLTLFGLQSCA